MKIILASASARRKEILKRLGFDFQIAPTNFNEDELEKNCANPKKFLHDAALGKARLAFSQFKAAQHNKSKILFLAADTIGVQQGKILRKVKNGTSAVVDGTSAVVNRQEAYKILQSFSDNKIEVLTGLAIIYQDKEYFTLEKSIIYFKKIKPKEIQAYLNTKTFHDKAAALDIENILVANFVKRIDGCYFNIMGLPIRSLKKLLKSQCQNLNVK